MPAIQSLKRFAKKVLMGERPRFLFVGGRAPERALGATGQKHLEKIPGLKHLLSGAHWQDIPVLNPKASLKDYAKAISKVRGGSLYIHNPHVLPTEKLLKIKELARKKGVKAINVDPDIADLLTREKPRMGKMLRELGAGGERELPRTPKGMEKFLKDPKNRELFIKSKWGAEGSGIMGKVKDLTAKEKGWLLADPGMREGHFAQRAITPKRTITGTPREFRVHARDRDVVDIGGRHGLVIPSKEEKKKIKEVVEKYHKRLERGAWGAEVKKEPKLMAYDIAFTEAGKPVIHEYQPGSGLHAHAFSGALRKLVKHETKQDPIVRRLAKRLAIAGGTAGAGTLGYKTITTKHKGAPPEKVPFKPLTKMKT